MTPQNIAQRLENIYQGEPWFGESLQIKLESVSSAKAYQQPVNNSHSIAEILSHMEFWRKSFIEQLQGNDTSAYSGDNPGNWPSIENLKKLGWEKQKESFQETQNNLVKLLKASNSVHEDLLSNLNGLVDHDIYHIGQIGIVKSLVNQK